MFFDFRPQAGCYVSLARPQAPWQDAQAKMSNSPVSRSPSPGVPAPEDFFAQLEQSRKALQEEGRQYQAQLASLEEALTHELEQLFRALQHSQQEAAAKQEELQQLRRELQQQQQRLARQRSRLARRLWKRRHWLLERLAQKPPAAASAEDPAARERLQQAEAAIAELTRQVQQLQQENARWEQQCRELQQQLEAAQGAAAEPQTQQELEDLRRRYQMALEDLRAEQARVQELQARIDQAGQQNSNWGDEANLDWERQKQQLLAALEADFDEDDPQEAQQRLQIEEVIQRTDRILAEKEREIAELKKVLDEQSSTWEGMALGAAAVAELLDKDEIVRQERENLKALQEQWKEKLRQAEVELSLERAKLARQKTEIDDKLHELQQKLLQLEKMSESARAAAAQNTLSKTRQWLKRLGLLKEEED